MSEAQQIYERVFELADDHQFEQALSALRYLEGEVGPEAELIALRARLLLLLGRNADAEEAALEAIATDDGYAYAHETAALVALTMREPGLAIPHAQRAQAIDPARTSSIMLEARANALLGRWERVESLAARVRELDPASEDAITLHALMRELRSGGSDRSVDWDGIADRFPLDPMARTGRAWSLLRRGKGRAAEAEFRQALTLDGSSEWARMGLVQALKTRYPGYGLLLRALMALGALPPRQRFFLIIGGLFAFRLMRTAAKANPSLLPFLAPLMAVYIAFVLGSWLADPLLNLALLGRKEGRELLPPEDRQSGLFVGGVLALALAFALGAWMGWEGALLAAVGIGVSSLTIAAAYQVPDHRRKAFLVAGFCFVGSAVIAAFAPSGVGVFFLALSILGAATSTWVASAMSMREESRYRE